MKDQHSTSADNREPPRPKTIGDDLIWDPETRSWTTGGEPCMFDAEASLRETEELIRKLGPCGLISVDELRAAGALRDPASRRKPLRKESGLLFDLSEDEHATRDEASDDEDAE